MEIFLIIALAIALVLAGCTVTFVVAGLLPLSFVERAQRNGRFVGLGTSAAESGGDSGKRVRVPAPAIRSSKLQLN
jgi:hypothetical protein